MGGKGGGGRGRSKASRTIAGRDGWRRVAIEGRGSGKGCDGVRSSVLGNWVNEKIEKERRCYRGSASAIDRASDPDRVLPHPSFIPLSALFPENLSRKVSVSIVEQLKSPFLSHTCRIIHFPPPRRARLAGKFSEDVKISFRCL